MTTGGRLCFAVALAVCACGGTTPADQPPAQTGWAPGTMLASLSAGPRGMRDVRGLIHAHSVYSHDACDNEPRDEKTGALDAPCMDDMRRGMCQARHDFVMLTDHGAHFAEYDFPGVLLHAADHGDELVTRVPAGASASAAVANWLACTGVAGTNVDAAHRTLVTAGTETAMMPVGLEHHIGATAAARDAAYSAKDAAGIAALKAAGAVLLAQHTEDWTPEQLLAMGFDGFEMYNLHANAIAGAGGVLALGAKANDPELMLAPDLALLAIVNEDARYLTRWGTVMARGGRHVTTMGTDCHRNSFPTLLADGERMDSYRRMMGWFSNHVLLRGVDAKTWDDRALKEALRAGRLYGAFEVMGYPEGFDFRAEIGGAVHEMGEEVAVGAELVVVRPRVRDLATTATAPAITLRILRAQEGGWQIAAETDGVEMRTKTTMPGAYRVEVRMRPRHLAPYLASFVDLAEHDFPWIYSNAIHVK
jgi:hypothetical protein